MECDNISKNKKTEYGSLPIRRVKQGDRHPHVVVLQGKKENISVGLTTKNSRGDLIKVKYSNGKTGYMKRTATRQKANLYEKKDEKYKLDKVSEEKAYRIGINKLLNDKKNKK